jgi:hypothetical protein
VVFGVGRTLIEVIHHHYANTSYWEELMGPKKERVASDFVKMRIG